MRPNLKRVRPGRGCAWGVVGSLFYGLPAVWGGKVEDIIVKAVYDQVKKVR